MNEIDISILTKAKEDAEKRVQQDPTMANLSALEKAAAMLKVRVGQPDEAPRFKNRVEVAEYLQNQGYKVKKSKVYNDVKAGILRVNSDGTVSISQVDKYINHPKSGLLKIKQDDTGGLLPSPELEDLQRKKVMAEIRKLEESARKMEFEREKAEGRHISRDLLDMELASRAAVFEAGIKHIVTRKSIEWIRKVNGTSGMADDFIDMVLNDIDDLFNDIASADRFTVEFV